MSTEICTETAVFGHRNPVHISRLLCWIRDSKIRNVFVQGRIPLQRRLRMPCKNKFQHYDKEVVVTIQKPARLIP